jgi:hypothetical protein
VCVVCFIKVSREGIRRLMGEKGLMEEDWKDRYNWRKKII